MKKITVEIISALLVALWAYAAISKLLDYGTFKFQLGRSPYVTNMAGFVAWFLPLTELTVATLLIINKTRLLGLYSSFFLMLLFTGYIYAMLHFSYYIPCSCGGILSKMDWKTHFEFNVAFTILPVVGILLDKKPDRDHSEKQISLDT